MFEDDYQVEDQSLAEYLTRDAENDETVLLALEHWKAIRGRIGFAVCAPDCLLSHEDRVFFMWRTQGHFIEIEVPPRSSGLVELTAMSLVPPKSNWSSWHHVGDPIPGEFLESLRAHVLRG